MPVQKSWFVLLAAYHSRLIHNLLCFLEKYCLWLILIFTWVVYSCISAWNATHERYSMTYFKETMMYMVIIREKPIVYMPRIQGMIYGKFASKYMTLIFGTILVRQSPSLDVYKQRLWHLSRWFVSKQLTAYVALYTLFGDRRNCIWRLIVLCCPSRRISEQSFYSIWRSYCTKHTSF